MIILNYIANAINITKRLHDVDVSNFITPYRGDYHVHTKQILYIDEQGSNMIT